MGSISTILISTINVGIAEAISLTTPSRISFRRSPDSPDTWIIPINRQGNSNNFSFNVDKEDEGSGWLFTLEQTSNSGNISIRLLNDSATNGSDRSPNFVFVNRNQRFDSARTANRIIFNNSSRPGFVNDGRFQVRGRGEGRLEVKSIPEPFSTAAAGLLAIAGAARTLKRKRTGDA